MVTVARLADIPLFEGLDPVRLAPLAAIAAERAFRRGQAIFAEGDPGTVLHIVAEGRVKIFKLSPEGKEQILHVFDAGEPFGEVAVFSGGRFPAHAEALDDCRTIAIPRPALVALLADQPELALELLGVLSIRLRRFAAQIEALALKEVPARLAGHLLLLAERQGGGARLELDLAKSQLANLIGTVPETLSRILARLAKDGYLELGTGRELTLRDRDGLVELATGRRKL